MNFNIYLSISIFLSNHIYLINYLPIFPIFLYLSIYLILTHPSVYQPVCLSICPTIRLMWPNNLVMQWPIGISLGREGTEHYCLVVGQLNVFFRPMFSLSLCLFLSLSLSLSLSLDEIGGGSRGHFTI